MVQFHMAPDAKEDGDDDDGHADDGDDHREQHMVGRRWGRENCLLMTFYPTPRMRDSYSCSCCSSSVTEKSPLWC